MVPGRREGKERDGSKKREEGVKLHSEHSN